MRNRNRETNHGETGLGAGRVGWEKGDELSRGREERSDNKYEDARRCGAE